MKFYFDIGSESPNYEEEYFYGKSNTKRLEDIANWFFEKGIIFSIGDVIDVDQDKSEDCLRFLIVERSFNNNDGKKSISFRLHYTDDSKPID